MCLTAKIFVLYCHSHCLVTAAITAELLALPSNGVTWLTPRMRAHQICRYTFAYCGTVSHPFFSSAHRGHRRYHVKNSCTHIRQYIALLFYIILWSEQECVAGNVIKTCSVYCVMSVCSCLVMILKFCIFSAVMLAVSGKLWLWYGGWLLYRCRAT
jgi:hypothetical protein